MALPDQLDYLAAVDLQNRRGLDLLTLEKGEGCLFLNEECCFCVNSWGAVRDMVQQLNGRVRKSKEEIANSWSFWNNMWSSASWLLPLLGSLLVIFLALLFGPCIITMLTGFVTACLEA